MLQGSLENFSLDEVLQLLSGTSKTGQLDLAGNRGSGTLVFKDGKLVGASCSNTANGSELEDVMFELLRFGDGTFTFNGREVEADEKVENVSNVLAAAENRLRDWRSIEAIVPSLNHVATPEPELPAEEVTIDRAEWSALRVIAAGCPVSLVCDELDLGEVEGSRQVKNLIERKLVSLAEPTSGSSKYSTSSSKAADPISGKAANNVLADATVTADTIPAAESDNSLSEFLTADRPPMPPAPSSDDLAKSQPPSPAEIDDFGNAVADASELDDDAEKAEAKEGGLLSRYLKD